LNGGPCAGLSDACSGEPTAACCDGQNGVRCDGSNGAHSPSGADTTGGSCDGWTDERRDAQTRFGFSLPTHRSTEQTPSWRA
jgi:hypothetical protein